MSKAGISFYMYSADPFMVKAREYFEHPVSQQAIEEVQEIREQDERYLENIQKILDTVRVNNQVITQMIPATQFPTIMSKELLASMNAAAQFPTIISKELLASMNAAAQFPTIISKELLASMNAAAQFPTIISKELLASMNAAAQLPYNGEKRTPELGVSTQLTNAPLEAKVLNNNKEKKIRKKRQSR